MEILFVIWVSVVILVLIILRMTHLEGLSFKTHGVRSILIVRMLIRVSLLILIVAKVRNLLGILAGFTVFFRVRHYTLALVAIFCLTWNKFSGFGLLFWLVNLLLCIFIMSLFLWRLLRLIFGLILTLRLWVLRILIFWLSCNLLLGLLAWFLHIFVRSFPLPYWLFFLFFGLELWLFLFKALFHLISLLLGLVLLLRIVTSMATSLSSSSSCIGSTSWLSTIHFNF